jgi:hypothetical protein
MIRRLEEGEKKMALKIEYLDETSVRGTLDGMLPFELQRREGVILGRIAGWSHELRDGVLSGIPGMRHATYSVLARFRESQRRDVSAGSGSRH